jgi:hypothetical protein
MHTAVMTGIKPYCSYEYYVGFTPFYSDLHYFNGLTPDYD